MFDVIFQNTADDLVNKNKVKKCYTVGVHLGPFSTGGCITIGTDL